ncbi:transposable element Tcb2 transposase [Trichonephila clavipes]|nr:transposable element Tcb2 transposase [Trichonephila clavipes]
MGTALNLAWARQQRHWTVDDEKHVAWSDEFRFQLNRARWTCTGMETTIQRTVQAGEGSVMVWGMCSWRDIVRLIRLDTTSTCNRYVSILSNHLHPFLFIVPSDGLGEFQQDSVTRPQLLHIGSGSTLLNLDTSAGHP